MSFQVHTSHEKPTFIFIISWEYYMSIWIHKKLTNQKRFRMEAFCSLNNLFDDGGVAFMLFRFKHVPQRLDFVVGFQFRVGLRRFYAVLNHF